MTTLKWIRQQRLGVIIIKDTQSTYWVFFFKQKTAYEIGVRLVGSEMCIRDRRKGSFASRGQVWRLSSVDVVPQEEFFDIWV